MSFLLSWKTLALGLGGLLVSVGGAIHAAQLDWNTAIPLIASGLTSLGLLLAKDYNK